jgi:4-amino-4-deoxy-L-arabinose transferase-like glycosyltransferase
LLYQAGTAFLAFLLGRRIYGDFAGAVAGALFLTSPLALVGALCGNDDIGFAFFFMAALLALVAGLDGRRERYFALAGVLGALALLEKPTGMILPGIFLGAILVPVLRREWSSTQAARAYGWALAPLALGFGCYLLRNQASGGQLGFRMGAYDWVFKSAGLEAAFGLHDPLPSVGEVLRKIGYAEALRICGQQVLSFLRALYLPSFQYLFDVNLRELGLGIVALPLAWPTAPRYGWICALSIAGGVGFVCVLFHPEARYFLFLVPLLSIAVGGAAAWLWRLPFGHPWLGRALSASLLLAALVLASGHTRNLIQWVSVVGAGRADPCADAMEWIVRETPADARILTPDPWSLHWKTRRETVLLPSGPSEDALRVARHYATGLLVDKETFLLTSANSTARRMARGEVPGASAERLAGNDVCAVYRLELSDQVGSATPR